MDKMMGERFLILLLMTQGCLRLIGACQVNNGDFVQIYTVPEEQPIGATVGILSFDDPSSVKSIRVSETNRFFTFDPSTLEFTVQSRVDADGGLGVQTMLLSCFTQMGIELEIEIEFELQDVNDFDPSFMPDSEYNFTVSESAERGTQIGFIEAKDNDIRNLYVEYSLLPSKNSSLFNLQSVGRRVALNLNASLDYETNRSYTLHVIATDCQQQKNCRQNQRTSTATVNVNVADADDLNPEFDKDNYRVSIFEDSVQGTLVVQVFAQDLDELNDEILYSLTGDGSQYFSISRTSGRVTVQDTSGLVKGRNYLMQVKAYQENDEMKRATASLVVTILQTTGNAPEFTEDNYSVRLSEGSPVDSSFMTLTVIDRDEDLADGFYNTRSQDPNLIFSIISPVTDFKLRSTGASVELLVARTLDYENITEYDLIIQVSDGEYTDTAHVKIIITNDNDHNPVFDEKAYAFETEWIDDGIVGQVRATDLDEPSGDNSIKYSILPPEDKLFDISSNGEITIAADMSQFKKLRYTLNVQAMDSDKSPRTTTMLISVTFTAGLDEIATTEQIIDGEDNSPGGDRLIIYVVAAVAGFLLIIVAILIICFYKRRSKRSAQRAKNGKDVELTLPVKNTDTMTTIRSDDQNSCTPLQTFGGQQDDVELSKGEVINANRPAYSFSYREVGDNQSDHDMHARLRQNNLSRETTPNNMSSLCENVEMIDSPGSSNNNLPPPMPTKFCTKTSYDSGRSSFNGDQFPSQQSFTNLHIKSPSMDDADTSQHDEEVAIVNMKSRRDKSVIPPQGFISSFMPARPDVTNIRALEGPMDRQAGSEQSLGYGFTPEAPVAFRSQPHAYRPASPLSNTSDYGSNTPTPEITSAMNTVDYRQDLPPKNRELKARIPVHHQNISDAHVQPRRWDRPGLKTFQGECTSPLDPDRSVTPYSDASTEPASEAESSRGSDLSNKPKMTIYF